MESRTEESRTEESRTEESTFKLNVPENPGERSRNTAWESSAHPSYEDDKEEFIEEYGRELSKYGFNLRELDPNVRIQKDGNKVSIEYKVEIRDIERAGETTVDDILGGSPEGVDTYIEARSDQTNPNVICVRAEYDSQEDQAEEVARYLAEISPEVDF